MQDTWMQTEVNQILALCCALFKRGKNANLHPRLVNVFLEYFQYEEMKSTV